MEPGGKTKHTEAPAVLPSASSRTMPEPEISSASSSPSSCVSFSSFDEVPAAVTPLAPTDSVVVKFLCSYGGKIMPRRHDGKLRYVGGHTRVLTVHRSLCSFQGLCRMLRELCGWDDVSVRCQLPAEDVDALVSVTHDDDLASVLDEYDVAAARQDRPPQQQLRVRVFLHSPVLASRTTTPRTAPLTPAVVGNLRRSGHHFLTHAARAAPPHAGRFILVTPLTPGSPFRAELFCQ